MRADRLVALLLLLQTRGRMTAQELAERLEVSERTVYRDMSALGMAGVPVYAERGPGGGCSLAEGYRTNLTGLTEVEARTLFMSSAPAILKDLGLGKTMDDALLKLLAALPVAQRRNAERARARIYVDPMGWWSADENIQHLGTIQEAIWNDRKLRMVYRKPNSEVSERVVDPLGLVAKSNVWYLVATAGALPDMDMASASASGRAGELRTYRISRVQAAEVLDDPCTRPDGFDLAAFWEAWSEEFGASLRQYAVRLRFSPELFQLLPEIYGPRWVATTLARAEPPDAAGWVAVPLTFDSLEDARSHVLSLGPGVEVLEPPELRADVIRFASGIAAFYAERRYTLGERYATVGERMP
jgi:predicted DNA-binding transcriptional regulator YafY